MKLRHKLLGGCVIVAAGYLLYNKLLSETAKQSVENLVTATGSAYSKLNEVLNAQRLEVVVGSESLPNVQQSKNDWNKIGY